MTQIVRSARQASTIFALDGTHPPRPKNLFYVSFQRGTDTSVGSSSSLGTYSAVSGDLGFLVKSTDRPQVQPTVEELNQYNKRRLIHTGVKYSPVRITFYDTTDNLATQMFADYASNYFGSFGHGDSREDYLNDILSTPFNDTAGTGYGFAPTAAANTNTDLNSIYYFRKISLYEVWGSSYTQTDLINPRIIAFDPEPMSYESAEIATISISINYEAIVYINDGAPVKMGSTGTSTGGAADPSAVFSPTTTGANFTGDTTVIQTDSNSAINYTDYKFVAGGLQAPAYPFVTYSAPEQTVEDDSYLDQASVVTEGPLANYGDYDFGSGFDAFQAGTYSSSADLLGGVQTSTAVASAVNAVAAAGQTLVSGVSGVTIDLPATTFASDQADVALASVTALGTFPSGPDTSFYAQKIAAGAMSASKTEIPREKIYTTNPKQVSSSTNSWDSSTPVTNGVALSSDVYAAINQQRPASAQIGFNSRTIRSQTG